MLPADWGELVKAVGLPMALVLLILWAGSRPQPWWFFGPAVRAQEALYEKQLAAQRSDFDARLAAQRADGAARLEDAQNECKLWRELALRSTVLADRATDHAVAATAGRGRKPPGGG